VSKLEVDKITPQSGTTLTIGEAGDTTVVNGLGTLPATIGSAAQVLSVNAGATGLVYGTAVTDLSNLNATNLTSGTVPDGRFPSVLPAAGGQNLTSLQPAAIVGGTFGAINSANLTNLNATALTSGTLPDGRFPSTLPAISGANLTNLPAGGTNTPCFFASSSSDQVINNNSTTKLTFSNEVYDVGGVYNPSNYRFTPGFSGKSYISVNLWTEDAQSSIFRVDLWLYKNSNPTVTTQQRYTSSNTTVERQAAALNVAMEHDDNDYFEMYGLIRTVDSGSATILVGSGNNTLFDNYFTAFKIIE